MVSENLSVLKIPNQKNTGIYELRNDKYFYVLGVNLHLVFSKIKPEYRTTVFTENQTFDSLLVDYLNHSL